MPWTWYCPTCGDHGKTEAHPTFHRCLRCDSAAPKGSAPPPLVITNDLHKLVEHAYENAIIRAITIVEEEMAKTSPDTGHGKGQRAFGRKLLERFRHE